MSLVQPFAERRAARVERLQERAAKARAEGEARLGAAHTLADRIPFGQPILVGHHSERRARRDAQRIHDGMAKGFAALGHADELARRAAVADQNTAISSDDPEAVTLLREKLAVVVAEHAAWKVALKGPGVELKLLAMGVPQITADHIARHGGAYRLTNLRAEARRIEKRIAELLAAAARPVRGPETIGDVTISESDNRVQVRYPGKPDEATRARLKSAGFRWAPSVGAWVRSATEQSWRLARALAGGAP